MNRPQEQHAPLCAKCGGQLHDVTVSTVEKAEFPAGYVIFENVPAQECRNCGELWFSIETMRHIEVAAKRERPPLRKIEVPLYDLASSAAV